MKRMLVPVSKYYEYSGTMELECGHMAQKKPGMAYPKRSRCKLCERGLEVTGRVESK